ncbi:MAG: glycosyltransferase family 2 protein [Alphaproteobacteria bacterium]|nr:glycosyltransferase family 2 protein [Alphaproteobacteria bacterium]
MHKPFVSVIIPTYNRLDFLGQTIKCCADQTLADIEFIFIDDASTDGSYAYLKEKTAADVRFKIFQQQKNSGPYACRNLGLKEARGKYIGFFDSDDIIPPDYFEKLYMAAIKNKADIVYTNYNQHKHILNKLNSIEERFQELRNGALWDKIYKHTFLKKYHMKFVEGLYTADNIFVVKSFYYAKNIALIAEPRYQWIKRPDSIGKDIAKKDKRKEDILKVLTAITKFARKEKIQLNELQELKNFCERSLKSYKRDEQFVRRFDRILSMEVKKIDRKEPKMLSILKLERMTHLISKEKYDEKRQTALVEASSLFDRKWYLSQNPDVKSKKMKAAKHYVKIGYKEGRNPSPYFDGKDYLRRYKDVAKLGINPLVHYILHGEKEGRTYKPATKETLLQKNGWWEKIKSILTYPIRVKEEYDQLKAEIKALEKSK